MIWRKDRCGGAELHSAMLTWSFRFVLALGLVVSVVGGVAVYGSRRWVGAAAALMERLEATRLDAADPQPATARVDFRELAGLPAPVQRYFRTALTAGRPIVSAVTLELAGTFNLSPTAEQWKPFTSRQRIVTRRPGFLWDAEIAMLPGVLVRVHDGYIGGRGLLHAAVLGLFTIANLGCTSSS